MFYRLLCKVMPSSTSSEDGAHYTTQIKHYYCFYRCWLPVARILHFLHLALTMALHLVMIFLQHQTNANPRLHSVLTQLTKLQFVLRERGTEKPNMIQKIVHVTIYSLIKEVSQCLLPNM